MKHLPRKPVPKVNALIELKCPIDLPNLHHLKDGAWVWAPYAGLFHTAEVNRPGGDSESATTQEALHRGHQDLAISFQVLML